MLARSLPQEVLNGITPRCITLLFDFLNTSIHDRTALKILITWENHIVILAYLESNYNGIL